MHGFNYTEHSAVPLDGTVQQALDGGHLPPPTYQIRLSTAGTAMLFPHAQQPLGRDGLIRTLDLNLLGLAESRSAINQPRGGCAEHYATQRSHRLHALCHPHLLTYRGVTERTRTDFTGDHLTRVQAHAQLEFDAVMNSDVNGQPGGSVPHDPHTTVL